ncbi:hypothetical protein IAT38_000202 [Cryptococcus sp. DSM 104549]
MLNGWALDEHWHEYGMEGGVPFSECYLETIDEPFDITLSRTGDLLTTCDINAFTDIDGQHIKSMSMADGRATAHFGTYKYADEEGRLVQSVLRFRPLPTTDDPDEATVTEAQVDRLGTVEVTFRMGERREFWVDGRGGRGGGMRRNSRALEVGVADERIKKMAYAVTTSDAMPCSRRQENNRDTKTVWEYFGPNGGWVYRMYFHVSPQLGDEASPRPATPPFQRGYSDDDRRPRIPPNKRWREPTEEEPEPELEHGRESEDEDGASGSEVRRGTGAGPVLVDSFRAVFVSTDFTCEEYPMEVFRRLAQAVQDPNAKGEPDKKRLKVMGGDTYQTAVDLTLLDDDDEEEEIDDDDLDELVDELEDGEIW